jgi:preprotein translocase subunit SecF
MRNKNYLGGMLAVAILLVVGLACTGHGTKLEFNGGELYYTKNVTEAEAKKLGTYLVEQEFFDGKPKSVQLDKSGSTYQFRMVVQPEKQNDAATLEIMKAFGSQLSSGVFNNAPVEIHICDDQLKTLKVVKP